MIGRKNEKSPQVFSCFDVSNDRNRFVLENFYIIINDEQRGHNG